MYFEQKSMENNVTTRIFGWDFEKEMNLLVWRVIRYVTNGLRGFNFQSIWIWLPDIVLKFTVGIVPHMLLCYTCLNCSEFNINCTRRLKRKKNELNRKSTWLLLGSEEFHNSSWYSANFFCTSYRRETVATD